MTWVVTIHDGGGSMAEAMDVEVAIEMLDEKQANDFADAINAALAQLGEDYKMAQAFETTSVKKIAFPQATAAEIAALEKQAGRKMSPSEIAIDILGWVKQMLQSYEDGTEFPKMKPPEPDPVTPEEEAEAIRLLTGGAP